MEMFDPTLKAGIAIYRIRLRISQGDVPSLEEMEPYRHVVSAFEWAKWAGARERDARAVRDDADRYRRGLRRRGREARADKARRL